MRTSKLSQDNLNAVRCSAVCGKSKCFCCSVPCAFSSVKTFDKIVFVMWIWFEMEAWLKC